MTNIITEYDQRHYSVAIPFIDEKNLLFQVRSDKLNHQPGDICFPGGAVEKGESPEEAVIREMTEELLLTKDQIDLQKEESLLINDSAIIHCFPCRIHGYEGVFNPEEVSEVFSVPITFFENTTPKICEVEWKPVFREDFPFDKIHGGRDYGWRPRISKIRFYEYEGRVIWGMTARIIEDYVMKLS
jgi:8-oxo-dGTP pyrophosphatase MutT (NUDIX family)